MSDINGVYKVCNKRENRDGKTWWDDTGLRVFIGEWEGKPSVSVFDARLGAKFPAFRIEKRQDAPQVSAAPSPAPGNDVPW